MTTINVLGVDPRSQSKTTLKPPAPLPHVSRRALARARDRIEPPTSCHCCGGPVKLTNNRDIYNGQSFGDWPYVYRCAQCQAYVGLHPDTDLPLGIMADRQTIQARKDAKTVFQRVVLVKHNRDRKAGYAWLARALEIPLSVCHFGMFDNARALAARDACRCALEVRQ